jgi:hypothetical protein
MSAADTFRLPVRRRGLSFDPETKEEWIMSARFAARQHTLASQKKAAARTGAIVVPAVRKDDAAADDQRPSILRDPLWGMAIATGILFAVLAALIASS